jgi:hypothetical protein
MIIVREQKERKRRNRMAKTILDSLWIPVSERLPEESDECLCCDKDGYMTIGGISKWSKEWYFDDDEINIDVAWWMPLPEPPYKAESEEK